MSILLPGERLLERMVQAVELVRDRLLQSTAALETARVPYAVVGDNAVAAWVAKVDRAAVRNTQDVGIALRRADLPAATVALEAAGFVYRHSAGIDMFLDGHGAKARDAVHIIFANEKVRQEYALPVPDVTESQAEPPYRILSLDALVRMKLTSFRDKDRTHIRDMLEVGLVDATWVARVPPVLASRLQQLLDDPNG